MGTWPGSARFTFAAEWSVQWFSLALNPAGRFAPGAREVHLRSTVLTLGLRVPVLQVSCPPGLQRFHCGAHSAPDIGPEAFFGLPFVAKLEGA